jgi:hypothetical protein
MSLRQIIESINQTFKGQLDLERHGGRTPDGVVVRVLQRILAMTAAICRIAMNGWLPSPRGPVAATAAQPGGSGGCSGSVCLPTGSAG